MSCSSSRLKPDLKIGPPFRGPLVFYGIDGGIGFGSVDYILHPQSSSTLPGSSSRPFCRRRLTRRTLRMLARCSMPERPPAHRRGRREGGLSTLHPAAARCSMPERRSVQRWACREGGFSTLHPAAAAVCGMAERTFASVVRAVDTSMGRFPFWAPSPAQVADRSSSADVAPAGACRKSPLLACVDSGFDAA